MATKRVTQTAATLTIRDADLMTKKGRRAVAAWLRKQAGFFARHGKLYAGRFTARYRY